MFVGRLRDMWGGGFTETVRFLWEKHRLPLHGKSQCCTLHISRNSLSLADQDLLNILGSQSPWLIQPLPCEWHYHTWSCSTEIYESRFISRMKDGMNQCPNAAKRGISLLHGNCQAFTTVPSRERKKPINPRQPCQGDAVLRAVFTFWADQVPVSSFSNWMKHSWLSVGAHSRKKSIESFACLYVINVD